MSEQVLVLGGGIIGLSCAFEALRGGASVTVIEPGYFGGQASGAAAGMLAPFTENPEQPDAFFRLCLDSLNAYAAWASDIEAVSGIDVELQRSGSLTVALHEADLLPLQSRMAWQQPFGARAELVQGGRLSELEPLLVREALAAVYCPAEQHVYAPKLVEALEKACRRLGARMVDHAGEIKVQHLTGGTGGIRIETSQAGTYNGDRLIVCAGAWACHYAEAFGMPMPIHPIRGQICAYEVPYGEVRHMVFSSQAYWVGKKNGTLVCGASEDVAGYDTSVTDKGISRLKRWGPRVLPFLHDQEPNHTWAGLRPATRDGWPLIGQLQEQPEVIIAAGHYRNGILLSPITGQVVGDLLAGRAPATPIEPFTPARFAAAMGRRRA
ncbi:glycine oxidase [Paenibacillus phyllosphaerae]|uniref:glycine oxidase n=1 Tax=Paenibacillus phyllosphaerae TaxID=274593 RepID=A0A7W5B3A9_9BACL|nr:glycine oxidase ThiO [Paenibacillus phyllosphaerae]MBB3113645.1 glycine oxidase [Paenibacillus phyllosphaerae]